MVITLIRVLREGEQIPRGWGLAWRRACTNEAVFLPIPLNWIAGWGRKLYYWIAQGPRDELSEKWYRRGHEQTAKIHYDLGFRAGQDAAYQKMFPGYLRETVEMILKDRT